MARVLVVDDNKDMVDTTTALLAAEGHLVFGCYSGMEVQSCVRQHDPDVVLLDIRMPGKDGWTVAREIRDEWPGKRPMLIAITGEHPRSGHASKRAEVPGFDHFLLKHAEHDELLALISKAPTRR